MPSCISLLWLIAFLSSSSARSVVAVRTRKNSCFYNQHSLPQVRGLSPKPTKRCWEEGWRSHSPPCVASQQIFNVSHEICVCLVTIYTLWDNQSKILFHLNYKWTNHIHLIPKWRHINYSFVCMLISPLCLIFTSKFFCFLYMMTRPRGLINMQQKNNLLAAILE